MGKENPILMHPALDFAFDRECMSSDASESGDENDRNLDTEAGVEGVEPDGLEGGEVEDEDEETEAVAKVVLKKDKSFYARPPDYRSEVVRCRIPVCLADSHPFLVSSY